MEINKFKLYISLQIIYLSLFVFIYLFFRNLLKSNHLLYSFTHVIIIFVLVFWLAISEFFHYSWESKKIQQNYRKEYIDSKYKLFKFMLNFLFPAPINKQMNVVYLKFFLIFVLVIIWRKIITKNNSISSLIITILLVIGITFWALKVVYQHSPLVDRIKKKKWYSEILVRKVLQAKNSISREKYLYNF